MSALESGPATLAQLVSTTHLARPTAHRIAVALEFHRLVTRDSQGRFILGPRLTELASAAGEDHLLSAAGPVLAALRDKTHESAQLYRRQGDVRICVANAERPIGLRDSIPVGATMSMQGGSAAQVLLAWEEPDRLHRGLVGPASPPPCSQRSDVGGGLSQLGSASPGSPPSRRRYAVPEARSWPQSRSQDPSSGWGVSPAGFTDTWSWPRRVGSPRCSPTPVPSDGGRTSFPSSRRLRHPPPLRHRPRRWRAGRYRRASAPQCPTRARGHSHSCGS